MLLRLTVIASAVVMLVLSVRAVRAQDFSAAPPSSAATAASAPSSQPGQVYGYLPGQGESHAQVPAAPQSQPAYQPAYQPSYQAPYPPTPAGYGMPPAQPQQASAAPYGFDPAKYPSAPPAYGYNPQVYLRGPDGVVAVQPPASNSAPGNPNRNAAQYAPAQYGTQQQTDPAAYYQPPSAPRANADYRLGPGDKVRVTVYGESDLSGEYQIDGTGVVRLPLVGALRAAGFTAQALENEIGGALAQGYLKNPRVNVEITVYRPFYIIGAVNKPGEYPYVDHMSALNAVAMAGGFTDTAKQSEVYVRHEGSAQEVEVPTDQMVELKPGDTIRVTTTIFWDAMSIFTPLSPAALAAATIRF